MDLDNDIDIIVPLNPGGKLILHENNGSQSFTENTIDASVGGPREASVDLDLDGDIDIVQAVEGADALVWYENNGSQSFTKNTIDGSPGSARSVSVGDIDRWRSDISLTDIPVPISIGTRIMDHKALQGELYQQIIIYFQF